MENKLLILKSIGENSAVTQRDISKNTGMSLGSVNILIKRLVKKGLIKMERLNSRTIRYILTPGGLKEKAEATYRYIRASYKYINELDKKIDSFLESRMISLSIQVILYGIEDEICSMLQNKLNHKKIPFKYVQTWEELQNNTYLEPDNDFKLIVLVWNPETIELFAEKKLCYINILEWI